MNTDAVTFLSEIPPFNLIHPDDLADLAASATRKVLEKGAVIAIQNKTPIEEVLILRDGLFDLYFVTDGKEFMGGTLGNGNIYGGISILMNSGLSIRTVRVREASTVYAISKERFLDICTRYESFYQYFVDVFANRMMDESYAAVVAANQARDFLSSLMPFTFLPESELEKLAREISIVYFPKNTQLFVQNRSRLEYLYIVMRGAAERYYEQDDGSKTLVGIIGEGEIYGGISMLVNDGISVRSLKTIEDTYFYAITKDRFLDLCRRYEPFSEFFTDAFGQRMLDRSYAAIITKSRRQSDASGIQFFNQTVETFTQKHPVHCSGDLTIQEAARKMSQNACSSILVSDKTGQMVGIVTDHDLREKVIATGKDTQAPIFSIMSSPLVSVSAKSLVFETLMEMMQRDVKHVAVMDNNSAVIGMVTSQDLLTAQGESPLFMIRQIHSANRLEEVLDKHARLPRLIQGLIHSGAKSQNVTRLITTISDAILNKLIGFALEEKGPPPTDFVFMILGSEGRKEQTLKTDQDNAIIFKDVPPEALPSTMAYFLALGETVCNWLDKAGYAFCKGEVMAKNPKWCQPLSVWKDNFFGWIRSGSPEDLLQASIFFDFRGAMGNFDLIDELRAHLFSSLEGWAGFFRNLTENALHFKPPIGFFRNFVVESKGEHKDAFDIKGAMMPIVDFARIYALKYKIPETNTIERLHQIYLKRGLSKAEYQDLEQAYGFMMQLRFARQVYSILEENKPPDNYIKPKELSRVEQTTLKEIFKRVEKYQTKLGFEFTGIG